ncbi:uncharacterized protein B0I36DRAFT_422536 [Microdochium trichocladiopsis]|uniref:P-loop containing nucleoside triphosphate hydrolase protein n=1 Tax=Microdochium trichocladiopsis TaxID=1682393 RepID=A0A9P9BR19_9PEZI|nr:uncharacterized protein B0I36DRAFT_422536 [Microdochium trichocladiopsis]KAH7031415.1 hypothetical protein B0I36DRAFT_422536 [Microdochium trichocladiopsis]
MGAAPSIPTDSSRTVQVIGAGFSRTGTVSMQMALEILLKGPVLHGGTQFITREDAYCKTWLSAYHAGEACDQDAVLKHLLELYPDAKVVLVKRDPVSWWRSADELRGQIALWWLRLVMWPVPGWRWLPYLMDEFAAGMNELKRRPRGDGTGLLTVEEAALGPHALENYYHRVRASVPKDQLLEMELGDGWEPLCTFLGAPVPNQPFPRANDAAASAETAKSVLALVAQVWVGILGALGGLVYLGTRVWHGRHF